MTWRKRLSFLAILGLLAFVCGAAEIFFRNPFSPPDWPAWGWIIGPLAVGALCLFVEFYGQPAFEAIFGVDRVEDPLWKRALRVLGIIAILAGTFVIVNEIKEAGWF